MIARGVHHVSFSVQDLEASRRFYGEVLGLTEIERPDLGFPGAWYRAGDAEVHLLEAREGIDLGRPPGKVMPLANHSAFAIESYEGTLRHLEAHGVEVVATSPEIGQMWIGDPDGNVIELIVPRTAT